MTSGTDTPTIQHNQDTSTQNTTPTNTLVNFNEVIKSLPAELLKSERLEGVKSLEDLATRLVNAKLAPEIPSPDKYTLPQGVPEEVRNIAHKNNLTQEALDSVLKGFSELSQKGNQAANEALAKQGQDKLKEWGAEAEVNLQKAKQAVSFLETKTPGLTNMLKTTGYGNHPVILELFRHVGNMLNEGGFIRGDFASPKTSAAERMFPSQAKS